MVVDIGAAPGGWTQVVSRILENEKNINYSTRPYIRPNVIAADLNPIDPIPGCFSIADDFTFIEVHEQIKSILGSNLVDIVLSDIAPNGTGIKDADHYHQIDLCYASLEFAQNMLKRKKNSVFVCKVYHGELAPKFFNDVKNLFSTVKYMKPDASRKTSNEIYVIAKGFTKLLPT